MLLRAESIDVRGTVEDGGEPPPRGGIAWAATLICAGLALPTLAGCAGRHLFHGLDSDSLDEGFDAVCLFRVRTVHHAAVAPPGGGIPDGEATYLNLAQLRSGVVWESDMIDIGASEYGTEQAVPGVGRVESVLRAMECRSGEYALIQTGFEFEALLGLFNLNHTPPVTWTIVPGAVNYCGTFAYDLTRGSPMGPSGAITAAVDAGDEAAAEDLSWFWASFPGFRARFEGRAVVAFPPLSSEAGAVGASATDRALP
jgi:hypothetical protein